MSSTQKQPKQDQEYCPCQMSGYFWRMPQAYYRILQVMRNDKSRNLAFLILQELKFVFHECDQMVAGFVDNASINGPIGNMIPQPINTLQLGARCLQHDRFQELLKQLSVIPVDAQQTSQQSSSGQRLLDVTEDGPYYVTNNYEKLSGLFSSGYELFVFVLKAFDDLRLYIVWQKHNSTQHTCMGTIYGATCRPKKRNVFPSTLDIIFDNHKDRLKESLQWRPLATARNDLEILSSDFDKEGGRTNTDQTLEYFKDQLLKELGCPATGWVYFMRAVGAHSNQLTSLFYPSVRGEFAKDSSSLTVTALEKEVSSPVRRGLLYEIGEQGGLNIFAENDFLSRLNEDTHSEVLRAVAANYEGDGTVCCYPVFINGRLFGLTIVRLPADEPEPRIDSLLSARLNTLIDYHQVNGFQLIEAVYRDQLDWVRNRIPAGAHYEEIEAFFEGNQAIPELLILDISDPALLSHNPLHFFFSQDDKNADVNLEKLLATIREQAKTGQEQTAFQVLPALKVKPEKQPLMGRDKVFPVYWILSLQKTCVAILMLATQPLEKIALRQRTWMDDFVAIFKASIEISNKHSEMLRRGTRAAVAAIMGRNMSHNIGSHVLSYWTKKEQRDEESRRLFAYLRNRMDFIAEIATINQPAWAATMLLCRDVLTPFFRQTALLDYLGRSEDVHFSSCTKLGCITTNACHDRLSFTVWLQNKQERIQFFGWKDGMKMAAPLSAPQVVDGPCWYHPKNEKYIRYQPDKFDFPRCKDIEVSIPHSRTGLHALYCILENFIRNSVKHGGQRKDCEIRIVADISDPDLIQVDIEDSGQQCSQNLHQRLRDGLSDSLINDQGSLQAYNWGLKEMRIAACYLRLGRTDLLDREDEYFPVWSPSARQKPYITLCCSECNKQQPDDQCRVGFRLYLLKPKEAVQLVAQKNGTGIDDIEQIDQNDFSGRYGRGGVPHRLLLYDETNGDSQRFKSANSLLLPLRDVPISSLAGNRPVFGSWVIGRVSRRLGDLKKKTLTIVYRHPGANNVQWKDNINGACLRYLESQELPAITDGEMIILFDEHGKCRKNNQLPRSEQLAYYQEVTGKRPSSKYLLTEISSMDEAARSLRLYELFEAAITTVVIADERVWEMVITRQEVKQHLEDMNIFPIQMENKRLNCKDLEEMLETNTTDFVIIHQGLLDKMDNPTKNDILQKINDKEAILIIASGRGIPPDLVTEARFLEISTLESFLEEEDKYSLTQTLYALRRPTRG